MRLLGYLPKPTSPDEITQNPERFRLFTIASWFEPGPEAGFFGYHSLPLTDSNVGEAVLKRRVISGFDPLINPDSLPHLSHRLRDNKILRSRKVCYVAVAPVYEGELLTGALSIYRDSPPPAEWFEGEGGLTSVEAEAETLEDVRVHPYAV